MWSKRGLTLLFLLAVGVVAVLSAVAIVTNKNDLNVDRRNHDDGTVLRELQEPSLRMATIEQSSIEEASNDLSIASLQLPTNDMKSNESSRRLLNGYTRAAPTKKPTKPPTKKPVTNAPTCNPSSSRLTTYYGIADAPYTPVEAAALPGQVKSLPGDAEFLIHLGDIRNATTSNVCTEQDYQSMATILLNSPVPAFIVVGDNEWNDCSNNDAAIGYWRAKFVGFENNWNHNFNVVRHPTRTENFSFAHKNALYIGLNLVGGRVLDTNEWNSRLSDEVEWTKQLILDHTRAGTASVVVILAHADPVATHEPFFNPLRIFMNNQFQHRLPIMYMNGDGHAWLYKTNFQGQGNFLRIMLKGGTIQPPLKVMVDSCSTSAETAFTYDRRL